MPKQRYFYDIIKNVILTTLINNVNWRTLLMTLFNDVNWTTLFDEVISRRYMTLYNDAT